MSDARREIDWDKMFELALDPRNQKRIEQSSVPREENTCTMCGEQCAVKKYE